MSQKGGAPTMKLVAVYDEEETPELYFSIRWPYFKKVAIWKPGAALSLRTPLSATLILDFPASILWGIAVCCLYRPVYGILL